MDDIFKHHKPTHTSSIVITPPPTRTGHTGLVVSTAADVTEVSNLRLVGPGSTLRLDTPRVSQSIADTACSALHQGRGMAQIGYPTRLTQPEMPSLTSTVPDEPVSAVHRQGGPGVIMGLLHHLLLRDDRCRSHRRPR